MTSKPSLISLPTVSGTSPTRRSPSVTSCGIPTFTRQIIASDQGLRSRRHIVTNNIPFCNRNVTFGSYSSTVDHCSFRERGSRTMKKLSTTYKRRRLAALAVAVLFLFAGLGLLGYSLLAGGSPAVAESPE